MTYHEQLEGVCGLVYRKHSSVWFSGNKCILIGELTMGRYKVSTRWSYIRDVYAWSNFSYNAHGIITYEHALYKIIGDCWIFIQSIVFSVYFIPHYTNLLIFLCLTLKKTWCQEKVGKNKGQFTFDHRLWVPTKSPYMLKS